MTAREAGRQVLADEAAALRELADALPPQFDAVVGAILTGRGRVLTCGIGKSGHIARKTAATLSSTGTPAQFLHAAEAVHGDLGMAQPGDVVLLYSHSGETEEIVRLFPSLREIGAHTVLVTGRPESTAARYADFVLATGVQREACAMNLAPTTSTTAMLALSDALAIAVMVARDFTSADFARYHPSGTLGKRLLLRVQDVMRGRTEIATVAPDAPPLVVMRAMTEAGIGVACVEDAAGFVGLISEGDLRRFLVARESVSSGRADEMVNRSPSVLDASMLAIDALEAFQNHPRKIGEMPVLSDGRLAGVLVLKDLLRSGIV
ncbi:MAG: KpsF/GutQ family sugar-phosphate isomerase [Fimbriimonadaceae bacterium]|nr:KpsF/GutQ family sugar-phosphate isomerase [Fimbriimonadaceae bacterium]